MNYRLCLIVLILSCGSAALLAQGEADLRVSESSYGLVRTNITSTYDHTWGRVTDGFNVRISYEFLKRKQFSLSANFKHSTVSCDFRETDLSNGYDPEGIGLNGTHSMVQAGVTGTVRANMYGKGFVAVGMLNPEWSKDGFQRVSAVLMAMVMLRADRSTQLGVGILGMVNTTSKAPVFPVFFYRHRFNDKWLVNLYGAMLGFDYTPTKNDLFSIGADVDAKSFYFKPHFEGLPDVCRFTRTNFRPMLKYRRRLIPNLYLDAQAGYAINMKTRVNGVNNTREYTGISQKARPFVSVSVSYSL